MPIFLYILILCLIKKTETTILKNFIFSMQTFSHYTKSLSSLTLIVALVFLISVKGVAAEVREETFSLSNDLDVQISIFSANGNYVLLWIAPSFGFRPPHEEMARLLATQQFEVWLADLNEALFIPHSSSSMRKLTGDYVAELIETVHKTTKKKVLLMSGSYGAIPVLRGAHQWLLRKPDSRYLLGALLFSPNIYESIPPLGTEPKYLPVAYSSTIPILIFQGEKNGNRWQLPSVVAALESGGSTVDVEMMPEVIGLFYDPDKNPLVERYFKQFPNILKEKLVALENQSYALDVKKYQQKLDSSSGIDFRIKKFKGNLNPLPIVLPDVFGKSYDIQSFYNQVTLVNFWATWCTPCIKEIPSLNRLRQIMQGKPFELISINYAEEPSTIKEFLKKVDVDFPVLIDADGSESKKWKVIAFPSTFVIGPDGKIQYGVNAGIEWDSPAVVKIINQMLEKP